MATRSKVRPKQRTKANILKDLNKQTSFRAEAARKLQQQGILHTPAAREESGKHASRIPRPVRLATPAGASPAKRPASTLAVLQKKYGQRWLHAVFGRLPPAQARDHFQRQLLKRSLERWRDSWWESRREWRLMVRAECHDRYRLWRLVWRTWLEFVALERTKQEQYSVAMHHADTSLLKECWNGWRQYMVMCAERNAVRLVCMVHWETAHLSRSFRAWCVAYRMRLDHASSDRKAVLHHGLLVKRQHWLHWRKMHSALVMFRQQALARSYHHVSVLASDVLVAWEQYVLHRRQCHEQKAYAISVWRKRVIAQAFRFWTGAWQRRRRAAELTERISSLGARAIKRSAFIRWCDAVDCCKRKRHLEADAVGHSHLQLKKSALHRWREYTLNQLSQQVDLNKATSFSNQQTQRRCWLQWLCRCESEEEARLVVATHRARRHRSKVMLRRCFQQLASYAQWRRERKAAYAVAAEHFARKTLPKYFHRLQIYMHVQRRQAHRLAQAADFRRENLLACFFYLWERQVERMRESQHTDYQAVAHHSRVLHEKYFCAWHRRHCQARQQLVLQDRAVLEDERRLCSWALDCWRHALVQRNHLQELYLKAISHSRRSLMSRPFQDWRTFVLMKQQSYERRQYAVRHWSLRKQKKAFLTWRNLFESRDTANQAVAAVRQERSKSFLRKVVRLWHYWVRHKQNTRRMRGVADDRWRVQRVSQIFRQWRESSVRVVNERVVCEHRAAGAALLLQKGCQMRAFQGWRAVAQQVQLDRWKNRLASDMHGLVLLRRSFAAWQSFCRHRLGKKLCYRQALIHYGSTLQRRSLAAWQQQMALRISERRKTVQALFFWSCCLRLKAVRAWRGYTLYRRDRQRRYQSALLQHRGHLLQVGLAQWMAVGGELANRRQALITARHSETAVTALKCVWRCALHWRQWTRRRIGGRKGSARSPRLPPLISGGQCPMTAAPAPQRVRSGAVPTASDAPSVEPRSAAPWKHGGYGEELGHLLSQPAVSQASLLNETAPSSLPRGMTAVEIFKQLLDGRSSRSGGHVRTSPRNPALADVPAPTAEADVPSKRRSFPVDSSVVAADGIAWPGDSPVSTESQVTAVSSSSSSSSVVSLSNDCSHGQLSTDKPMPAATMQPPPAVTVISSLPPVALARAPSVRRSEFTSVARSSAAQQAAVANVPCQSSGADLPANVLLPPSVFQLPPEQPSDPHDAIAGTSSTIPSTNSDVMLMKSALEQHLERQKNLRAVQEQIDQCTIDGESHRHLTDLQEKFKALQERVRRDTPLVRQIAAAVSAMLPRT